jgi:hypothetical protein
MKSRLYLFAVVVALVLATPAMAQREIFGGVNPNAYPNAGGHVTARVYTTAILRNTAGRAVGKVRTGTVQTTDRGVLEGLRIQVSGLTPGAEYALVIDATLVGTGNANANGVLKLKFIAPSNGRTPPIPDAIRPIARAASVQIYETSSQRLVASGQFGDVK